MNPISTAVITGAGSGIGLALTRRALREGMNVVLADVDTRALEAARDGLNAGARASCVPTDVSDPRSVEALRDHALTRFGAIDLLFNNAGVGAGGGILETTPQDWDWVLGVNFGGVLNGIRAFLPHMLERNRGHIVNTSSLAGILPYHPSAPYQVSKTAVVSLTEQLYVWLLHRNSQVRTSVLCPGNVATRIMDSARLRPHSRPTPDTLPPGMLDQLRAQVQAGLDPDQVAEAAFDGLRRGEGYIVTHTDHLEHLERRTASILASAHRHATAA